MEDIKGNIKNNIMGLKDKLKNINLEKLKSYVPKDKPKINIGLDIGSNYIKAVVLKIENNQKELLNFAIKPRDKESIADSVNEVLKGLSVESKDINASISGQGVVVRCVKLPKMSVEDAKKAFGFEAEKHIPFSLDEVFLDCIILKQIPEENKMLVLVAAAKKDVVNQRLTLFRKLDMLPNLIDIDSLALVNIVNILEFNDTSAVSKSGSTKDAVALLNMGASLSSLCVIADGFPRFVRDIFVGGNDLTKRISNILGLSLMEAEKAKCNPAKDWEKVFNSCETILNNFINEVRRSFDYFESDVGIPIRTLYLSGGGSYLKDVVELFKQNLNVETKILNPIVDIKVKDELNSQSLESHARQLAVAFGLAIRLK